METWYSVTTQTFLRAHWGVIAGADFFTTEVWMWQGLVTYYTVLVLDLASRRVQILGSTPYANELFMQQVVRLDGGGCRHLGWSPRAHLRSGPIGERHFRRALSEYVEHYHQERNHQGLVNQLIAGTPVIDMTSRVQRRPRLGGLLNFYGRAA